MRVSLYNNLSLLKYNNLDKKRNNITVDKINTRPSNSITRNSLGKINNAHLYAFKAQMSQVVEPMNFKTEGSFMMVKQLFEHKAQVLSKDISKLQENLVKEYPNAKIDLPFPMLGVDGEAYGCKFQLLRIPTENEPRYIMVVNSNNKCDKIELKNSELIANFNPQEVGMTLNEYVLTGLEAQFASIKTQEKLDKLEDDYKLRDSKVSEYIDKGLEKVQQQVINLKQQVDSNTDDIRKLKKDIDGIDQRINALRKELIKKTNALYNRISIIDEDVEYPPLYVWDKGSLVEVCKDSKEAKINRNNSKRYGYYNWDYQLDESSLDG